MLSQFTLDPTQSPVMATRTRHSGIVALAILALLVASRPAAQAQTGCIGYCGNGVAIGVGILGGAAAGVGILVAVNHSNHFLKGCVSSGPDGPELQTSESKTWLLQGDSSLVEVGHMVRVHGSRAKKAKNRGATQALPTRSTPVFIVDKLKKDYGTCHAAPAPAAGAGF